MCPETSQAAHWSVHEVLQQTPSVQESPAAHAPALAQGFPAVSSGSAILVTNASLAPPAFAFWYALAVGKFAEVVLPAT